MRLEIESTPAALPLADGSGNPFAGNGSSSEVERLLESGISSARSGDRSTARTSLLRCTELDPKCESAWLWLSSISEYPEELLVFLEKVLDINPENQKALEWRTATNTLLAKTFLQRGIDAADSGGKEQAAEHFTKALEYDQNCALAWMWMANIAESSDGKLLYLEKALSIDPDNEDAAEAYRSIRGEITSNHLAKAKMAAVAGRNAEANELLEAVLAESPDSEEAWMLRSHIADGFVEKIRSYEMVLSINPANAAALANLDSLKALANAVPAPEVPATEAAYEPDPRNDLEVSDSFALVEASKAENNFEIEKHPTQDLEMPEGVAEAFNFGSQDPVSDDNFESPEVSEPESHTPPQETVFDADTPIAIETLEPGAAFEPYSDSFDADPIIENFSEPFEASASWDKDREEMGAPIAMPDIPPGDNAAPFDPFATVYHHAEPSVAFDPVPVEVGPDTNGESDSYLEGSAEFPGSASSDMELRSLIESVEKEGFNEPIPAVAQYEVSPLQAPSSEDSVLPASNDGPDERSEEDARCEFCGSANDMLSVACQSCSAVLSLSNLELLLANENADRPVLLEAVERLESERNARALAEAELTLLGIGHLNLRNYDKGFDYLQEASRLNPNNIVLSSQVNALHIRLEEIRQQKEAHDAMSKGKTILVIDDSPTIRKLIAGKLEKCGHEVFCSADGVEAVDLLEGLVPDLILLDINMPRMDGYQVCKLIRGKESTKDVPVVMISGKDGFFDKVRGRMAGTSGYITKPFGPETLMKVIESYLENASQPADYADAIQAENGQYAS
jgi:CheY-like chemotaxis protein